MSDLKRFGEGMWKYTAVLLCFAICLLAFCSCGYGNSSGEQGEKIDFLQTELDIIQKYIEIGQYKGLEISADGNARDEALWNAVEDNCKVKEYPISQVYYYRDQLEAQYKYYAEQAGMYYEDMCAELGVDSGSIFEEAKALTKKDLVYSAIVKLEGISLSPEEKEGLFDKYVEKYVSVYGYNAEYVRENMAEEIYSSMLYDKTTEFLLKNNNVK